MSSRGSHARGSGSSSSTGGRSRGRHIMSEPARIEPARLEDPSSTPQTVPHPPAAEDSSSASVRQTSTRPRLHIRPNGNEFLPSSASVGVISSVLKSKYDQPWTCWSEMPTAVHEMYWGEFQKYCMWDPADEPEIRRIWRHKSADTLRSNLASIRNKKSKGTWMSANVLQALQDRWNSDPRFKQKSEINKRNRAVSEGGCLNRGGSISICEHRRRYGQQLGRDPTMPELFAKLNHDQETNRWSTERAAQTYASFERLLEQSQAASAESSVDESLLFFQATGGKNKKGRAFGFGSEVAHYAPAGHGSASSSQTSAPQYDSSIHSQLQDRVIHLEAQMSENQQSVSQAVAQMTEQQQTASQVMAQMMSELVAIRQHLSMISQGPSVPPHSSQTPSVPAPTVDQDEEQEADNADDAALGDD